MKIEIDNNKIIQISKNCKCEGFDEIVIHDLSFDGVYCIRATKGILANLDKNILYKNCKLILEIEE